MIKRIWQKYSSFIIAIVSLAAVVILMWAFNIPCPIKHLTGLSCAGCGMSRAYFSALTLDLESAFSYHPLWIILPFSLIAIAILSGKKKARAVNTVFYCTLGLFIIVWIIRLLIKDATVAPDLENSILGEIIKKLNTK